MPRKQVATRLDDETVEAFEDYVESPDTPDKKNSEAFRRFVREGLANRDYPVPVADGGVSDFEDRLDTLEQQRQIDSKIHDIVLLLGVTYIVATLTLPVGGLAWLAAGVIVLVLVVLVSYQFRTQVSSA